MVLILPEHSQRPYRYGMTLLCIGAMFNWLGLADNNAEPVRYIGVTLIAAGAMLICLAMCFWMKATHDPQVAALQAEQDAMHHIVTIHRGDSTIEKPPDYDTVTGAAPPSYEDAIKLNPAHLLHDSTRGVEVVLKPEQEGQSTSTGSSTEPVIVSHSSECQVDVSKVESSSSDEGSSTDNFGTKVLRISRKFLQRSRSSQDVESECRPTETSDNTANQSLDVDVSIR
ncbi:uncharacterized protein LOC128992205 isoform X2 [Macrosteles quadrilineatus]|nr:uncharacterized protein LOC128992205 isoform X2 [Macrosteles quadrilineatus]